MSDLPAAQLSDEVPQTTSQGYRRWFLAFLAAFGLCVVAVLSLAALRGDSPALIVSDGKLYYSWARSLVVDRDLDFENDYRLLSPPDPLPAELARPRTPRGLVVNKYPVGLAILELPATAFAHLIASATGAWPADGVSLPYQVAVAAALAGLALMGLWLLFEACIRVGSEERWAFWLVSGSIAATNAVHYIAKEPAMSHAAGLGLFGLLAWIIARARGPLTPRAMVAAGAVLGLLVLVRNTNILLAPSVFSLLSIRGSLGLRRSWPLFLTAAAVALLQPLSIFGLWGSLRLTGYGDEGFTSGIHGIWSTLLSSRHGLFVYHPLYLILIVLNLAGLVRRESRLLAAAALGSFALLWVANGTWWCWWFGRGFGNRSFIEALGPLTIGAAFSLSKLLAGRARARVASGAPFLVVGLLSILNADLWVGYLLHRYSDDGLHSVKAAYLWVFDKRGGATLQRDRAGGLAAATVLIQHQAFTCVFAEREALGIDDADVGEEVALRWRLPLPVPSLAPAGSDRGLAALVHMADVLARRSGCASDPGLPAPKHDALALALVRGSAQSPEQLAREP